MSARTSYLAAFRQGMRALGYVEGQNFVFESRAADGKFDRLPALAKELIDLKPDVLFVSTTPANLAAKNATSSIPIVMVGVSDPIGAGLVASLARPLGNTTGITNITAELAGKRLELIKEIIPELSRIAVLINLNDANATLQLRSAEAAARSLAIALGPILPLGGPDDLEPAFAAAARNGTSAILRMVDPTVSMLRKRTIELAARYRIPVMYAFPDDVRAGGLVAYGPDLVHQYRQAASFIHRIFRGAKPADLPVEQPTTFELVVNLKSAKALGITMPQSVLLRADEVLE